MIKKIEKWNWEHAPEVPWSERCGHAVSWALPNSEDFHKWDMERVWLDLDFGVNIFCFLFTQVCAI